MIQKGSVQLESDLAEIVVDHGGGASSPNRFTGGGWTPVDRAVLKTQLFYYAYLP